MGTMDNMREVFMDEAHELIGQLEKDLLNLEQDMENKDSISSVFRSMHTLKGSAGMFGFEAISELTHRVETIYDMIRNGKCKLTTAILDSTLKSIDHLKRVLEDAELKEPRLRMAHTELVEEIETIVSKNETAAAQAANPSLMRAAREECTYYIFFNAGTATLPNGIQLSYLQEDLAALGNSVVLPVIKGAPSLTTLKEGKVYNGFEMVLCTEKTEKEIREVFLFVETLADVTITKTAEGNLLKDDEIKTRLLNGGNFYDQPDGAAIDSKTILKSKDSPSSDVAVAEIIKSKHVSNIRVSSERLDELMNLVSELVTSQASLSLQVEQNALPGLESIAENIEKITRRLRDNAFSMSLVPIESLVVRFQRLVRDLSHELNKNVIFKTEGSETAIDKSIIEKLTDPLLHLLRNSLDHGIEPAGVRKSKGKPEQGTLKLRAFYSGANVVIEISDDGAGLDLEKIRAKAISTGLLAPDAPISEQELIQLIFKPGFSTADKVTGVSGRGVGMDVVKRNISDMRGDIEVSSKQGQGTVFTVKLPLTLSIIDGLLVRIGETDLIFPLSSVGKCFEMNTKFLEETFNQWVTLDGQRTPFFFLRREFKIHQGNPERSQIISIEHEGNYVGLAVDRIIGEYQAVLKPLGEIYRSYDEFSGSTILGDGAVALVVDPSRLIKKFVHEQKINIQSLKQ